MSESIDHKPPRTRTFSVTLYPDDIDVIRNLAATQFEYNESEATRHILRWWVETGPQRDRLAPAEAR